MLRTIVPKFPGWRRAEWSTCAGDAILHAQVVTVLLPTAATLQTEDLIGRLIPHNGELYTRLRSVFRSKVKGKGKLFTIEVDDRFLEAIKRLNYYINYRFGHIPTHMRRESRG